MIEIYAPRYHDRKVLIAQYRIPYGEYIEIRILKGAYAGHYRVKRTDVFDSPVEGMTTKTGNVIAMRAVPLDVLERVE